MAIKRRLWTKNKIGALSLAIGARRFYALIFSTLSLILILSSVMQPQLTYKLRLHVMDVFAPVLQTISLPMQEAVFFTRNITGLASLQAENAKLQQENIKLRQWYNTALALEAENKSLQDLLHVKLEPSYSFITTRVVADAGQAYMKSLLLPAGNRDGIQKGQAVISTDGLIGRIIESAQSASRVLLITDVNSRVPVMLEQSSHHAILMGDNDRKPLLKHLPPDFKAENGMRVVTSGHGGVFPKGLPVGRVVMHGKTPHVELHADLARVVFVKVINKPMDINLLQGKLNP